MTSLLKISKNILNLAAFSAQTRCISLAPRLQIKEIHSIQEGKDLVIKANILPSGREPYMIKTQQNACPVCATGLDVKHTDVLILSQFVRSDGCMLPRRVTGLCKKQQRRVTSLVAMAQKAGLMPNLTPATSKKDPRKRSDWKKFNKYFDESTIEFK